METEIGHLGYSIPLKTFPPHFLENVRNDLCVKPLENKSGYNQDTKPFPVYRISKTKIYLPRYYGIINYKQPLTNVLTDYTPIDLAFNGTIRELQQTVIDKTLTVFDEFGGGLISLATGLGKTVVALKLITLVKVNIIIKIVRFIFIFIFLPYLIIPF